MSHQETRNKLSKESIYLESYFCALFLFIYKILRFYITK